MMQTTDVRESDDVSPARALDRAWFRALFVQCKMRSRRVIVANVSAENSFEMEFIEYDDMVQALAPYRADEPFHIRILPG